ncbi:MAG: DUF5906 domain-containing protein [Verrucomicrobiota bacterium]
MILNELVSHIETKTGAKSQRAGTGFLCRCPAHEDRKPSLSVSAGALGKLLVKCQAGCDTRNVMDSLGLKLKDLFPAENGAGKRSEEKKKIVATYDYTDARGKLLYQVVRFEPKDFRQRKPDKSAKDGWNWKLSGVQRVIYRLPEIMDAVSRGETVFICEGEKDVAALVAHGFNATCNAGGAGKFPKDAYTVFKDAKVVIIADKDEPGRKHAAKIATKIKPLAKSVKVLELPDMADKPVKDAADFFSAGGSKESFCEIVEKAGEFTLPGASQPTQTEQREQTERISEAGMVRIVNRDAIAAVPIYYYSERGKWFGPNGQSGFTNLSDSQAKSFIAEYGFNKSVKDGQGNTAAERAMIWKIQNNSVAYAGLLAGYPAGYHEVEGGRLLVTDSPRYVTPKPGQCPTILNLIQTMLEDETHDQVTPFFLWASESFTAFWNRMGERAPWPFRYAPAFALFGPRGCGKSALIDLILTPLFGGRKADPMNYLNEPKFNKDLFAASLLVLDDKGAVASLAERRLRGERIKDLIWKPEQRMEGKGADAVMLRPFWRLFIAGNDDDAGLQVCPALSESLKDKIIVCRATRAQGLPETHEQNDSWASMIRAELPAFAAFLLSWRPPLGLRLDERTRVLNFWHPHIVSALREMQPEMRLLELIDSFNLIGTDSPLWEGTASEFESEMKQSDKHGVLDRIFYNSTTAGRMLSELAIMEPERFVKTQREGRSYYRIFRVKQPK